MCRADVHNSAGMFSIKNLPGRKLLGVPFFCRRLQARQPLVAAAAADLAMVTPRRLDRRFQQGRPLMVAADDELAMVTACHLDRRFQERRPLMVAAAADLAMATPCRLGSQHKAGLPLMVAAAAGLGMVTPCRLDRRLQSGQLLVAAAAALRPLWRQDPPIHQRPAHVATAVAAAAAALCLLYSQAVHESDHLLPSVCACTHPGRGALRSCDLAVGLCCMVAAPLC